MENRITRNATFTFDDGTSISFPVNLLPYDEQEQVEALIEDTGRAYNKRVTRIDLD